MDSIRKERLSQILQFHAEKFNSQADFAKKLGISSAAFGTYVRAVSFPDSDNLEKIADYLGMSIKELRNILEEEKPTKVKENGNKYQVNSQKKKAEDFI